MAVEFTGRNIEVTPALRDFTLEKLKKLDKYLNDIIETHVILTVQKHRHIVEINIHSKTATLTGTAETEDMYSAIGVAAEKLERQALKHKEKIKLHHTKKGPESIRTAADSSEETESEGDQVMHPGSSDSE